MRNKNDIKGYYNNTKIANELRGLANSPQKAREKYVDGEYSTEVGEYGDKAGGSPIRANVRFRVTKALSLMDCVVLDAVTAFYIAAKKYVKCEEFTTGDLAEYIYGSRKARRKNVGETLDGLMDAEMTICIAEELQMRRDQKTKSGKKDAALQYKESIRKMINFKEEELRMSGRLLPLEKVEGAKRRYRFVEGEVPVLYEYASVVNTQFFCYPQALLKELDGERDKKTGSTWNTERVLLERYYLIGKLAELGGYFKNKRKKWAYDPTVIDVGRDKERDILFQLTWDKEQVLKWSDTQLSHRRNEVFEELIKLLEHFVSVGAVKEYSAVEKRGKRSVKIEKISYTLGL